MKTPASNDIYTPQLLAPLGGFTIFFFLYILAAILYPGGDASGNASDSFSITKSYWCDLMSDTTKGGAINHIRFLAIAAWCILCLSLCLFWIYLPRLFSLRRAYECIIQYAGVTASVAAMFSFTRFHDMSITLAGLFGTIALIPALWALKREHRYLLLALGVFCFLLGTVNYLLYTTRSLIGILPLLQKITYVICLFAFGFSSYNIYLRESIRNKKPQWTSTQNKPCEPLEKAGEVQAGRG